MKNKNNKRHFNDNISSINNDARCTSNENNNNSNINNKRINTIDDFKINKINNSNYSIDNVKSNIYKNKKK